MNEIPVEFQVGSLYSNEAIYKALSVGNAGGMRIRSDGAGNVRRAAIFTSIPTPRQIAENPYRDRLEGNVLIYTGTGRSGDQAMSGPNARIQQQPEVGFPLYGFVQVSSRRNADRDNKRWSFLGLLEYLRSYRAQQMDSSGTSRSVWVFELLVHTDPRTVVVEHDRQTAQQVRVDRGHSLISSDREVVDQVPETSGSPGSVDLLLLEQIRRKLLSLDPRAFELFIRDLLLKSGFQKVEVTRYSQDGGIDINAKPSDSAWAIRHMLVQIQAKRWLHTVGRKEVAELRGSLQAHAAGCIVTTSHFSRAALAESTEAGKVPIAVIDGFQLAGLTHSADLVPD